MLIGAIKTNMSRDDIIERLQDVMGWNIISRQTIKANHCVESACIGHEWRGHCIFIAKIRINTVVDNVSGCLGLLTKQNWLSVAGGKILIFQEYNDAIGYGQIIDISNGIINKYCIFDEQDAISESNDPAITSWIDISSIIDEDDDTYIGDEVGDLVIFANAV